MEFYNMKAFGKKIKELRKKRNFSRDYITEVSGISKGALTNIENGKSIPKLDTIHLLSIILKVDILMIFNDYRYNESSSFYKFSKNTYTDIIEGNIKALNESIRLYKEDSLTEVKKADVVIRKSVEREVAFFEIHLHYNSSRSNDVEYSIHNIFKKLEEIDYHFLDQTNFDYIDYRIGFLLADLLRRANQFEKSQRYLEQIEKELGKAVLNDDSISEFTILLCSGYAYLFHRLDEHEKVINYAMQGIELSYKSRQYQFLYIFYFRKIIASYMAKRNDYHDDVETLIMFLHANREYRVLENVVNSIEKQYKEIHEYLTKNEYLMQIINKAKETKV